MRILISNDDGIYSPGIAALATVAVLGRSGGLEQAKQFEDDHDNDDHSNYVKNVSIHAGDSYQIARAKVNIYPNLSAITAFLCSEVCLTNCPLLPQPTEWQRIGN